MIVSFELDDQEFAVINGGPYQKFTEAVSFVVNCEIQEEIDCYWKTLSTDPKAEQYGWLKDKYVFHGRLSSPCCTRCQMMKIREKVARVSKALLKMKKLDLNILKKALEG